MQMYESAGCRLSHYALAYGGRELGIWERYKKAVAASSVGLGPWTGGKF